MQSHILKVDLSLNKVLFWGLTSVLPVWQQKLPDVFTWAQQLSMDGFMEDDDCGAQGGQRDIQATTGRCGFKFFGEMLQISIWGITKKLEKVIVETVSMGAINYEVGDG